MLGPESSDVYEMEFVHEEDDGHSSDSSDENGEVRGYYLSTSTEEEDLENSSWDCKICNENIKLDDDSCTQCGECLAVYHLDCHEFRFTTEFDEDEEYFCSCVQELNARGEEVDVYKIVKDEYENEYFEVLYTKKFV
ncbi:hypothetical protein OROHE_013620 [Orobanche hederae]